MFTHIFDRFIAEPSYLELHRSGELARRAEKLLLTLKKCELCPRKCGVDRTKKASELPDGYGYCRSGMEPVVSSAMAHFGEEPELVGAYGSGTIFFSNCNLGCVYCQNFSISQTGEGDFISTEKLSSMMLELQNQKCHNINLVSPTHFIPEIVEAVRIACGRGLHLPLVYNCGGYENVEIIKLLDGIIDIYMPDVKYSDNKAAVKYSNAPDYFERCTESLVEMHRQVGILKAMDGIAYRGLLVRHLVLPENIAGSEKIFKFIANKLSPDTHMNIMNQYRPCYKAEEFMELNKRVSPARYERVLEMARKCGLKYNSGKPLDRTDI